MYTIPAISQELKDFAKRIGCTWIGAIAVAPKPLCKESDCHNNVLRYTDTYGGFRKIGYYFIKSMVNGRYEAILHSVVKINEQLLDITPFSDSRQYNIVGLTDEIEITNLPPHITSTESVQSSSR